MNKWIILLPMVLISLVFSCSRPEGRQAASPMLAFDSDGLFKIAQFTDLHWNPTFPRSAQTGVWTETLLANETVTVGIKHQRSCTR